MPAKPKKQSRRDFLAEAAAEVDGIVSAFPDRQAGQLYETAMQSCPAVRYWLDESAEAARQVQFGRLLRYSRHTLSDGRVVRKNLSYTKWVQTENGKEKQVSLWKHVEAMTRDEAQDAVRDLDKHIDGSMESRNAIVDYWNETHPEEVPLKRRAV